MKIHYHLDQMSLLNQSKCVGDLLRYYGESKYMLKDQIDKIKGNSAISNKIMDQVKKHTGNVGLTMEQFSNGLTTAADVDIFGFKINGYDISELFTKPDLELEITVNPIKFVTEATLKVGMKSLNRDKHRMEQKIQGEILKQKDEYIKWFERELNQYHNKGLWKKTIINR